MTDAFDALILVNYCHPDCTPLRNIVRLPREEAFSLAKKFADAHPETTAFYRFGDFRNYYALRMAQDAWLYRRFLSLGGAPEEEHPLSFVVEGSDYLRAWFGGGKETRLPLRGIDPLHVSFTVGDSGSTFEKKGEAELLTLGELRRRVAAHGGDWTALLRESGRSYIEAQLWSDRYVQDLR